MIWLPAPSKPSNFLTVLLCSNISGERVLRAVVVQCKSEVVGRKWGGVIWERCRKRPPGELPTLVRPLTTSLAGSIAWEGEHRPRAHHSGLGSAGDRAAVTVTAGTVHAGDGLTRLTSQVGTSSCLLAPPSPASPWHPDLAHRESRITWVTWGQLGSYTWGRSHAESLGEGLGSNPGSPTLLPTPADPVAVVFIPHLSE
ncbi:hypothetical protein Pcinc_022744 [Petrolisthes cinctipes]|uniref:Uncharacterized protein n=1 Tax=Petrolisthes cinctipes TaxID=88211 RepID=A0AAE1FEG4_PETCI|nr:hypothetical protein Pcinc_022744 [Petrolisthes cinctipes]